jgi:hypothetical protein
MATATRSSVLFVVVVALAIGVSCSCQGAPSITSISPSTTSAGGSDFVLTISGKNFVSYSMLNFNGSPVTPSLVTGDQLVATVPASAIAQPGTLQVLVLNPPTGTSTTPIDGTTTTTSSNTCGGYDSNAVAFTVSP